MESSRYTADGRLPCPIVRLRQTHDFGVLTCAADPRGALYSAVGNSTQFRIRVDTVPDRLAGTFEIEPEVWPAISSTLLELLALALLTKLRFVMAVVKD